MKNNKGFTLVELMAVIVVLALIITIAVPSAISISHKIKLKMYATKVDMIIDSAKLYGQDNPSSLKSNENACSSSDLTVQTLIDTGYIKKDDIDNGKVLNPIDNSPMNTYTLCVYKKNNRVYAKTIGDIWDNK